MLRSFVTRWSACLKVNEEGYSLREATQQEAEAFWAQREAQRKPFVPPRNLEQRDLVDLSRATVADVVSIGAKAANLAELARVDIATVSDIAACKAFQSEGRVNVPQRTFAIPFYWYVVHLQRTKRQLPCPTRKALTPSRFASNVRPIDTYNGSTGRRKPCDACWMRSCSP